MDVQFHGFAQVCIQDLSFVDHLISRLNCTNEIMKIGIPQIIMNPQYLIIQSIRDV